MRNRNKILLQLMGGMGNQLFQYSAARSLADKLNAELLIDDSLLDTPGEETPRKCELSNFHTRYAMAEYEDIEDFYPKSTQVLKRINVKIAKVLQRKTIFFPRCAGYDENFGGLKNNVCLIGQYQSEKYFIDNAKSIREDLTLKQDLSGFSIKNIIGGSEVVALHVRRTDYVNVPRYSKILGALDISYYREAISYLSTRIENPLLLIVSDDTEWCIEHLRFDGTPVVFANDISKGDPLIDFYLIQQANHHVIANSTFSWWAAWLGRKSGSITIAPSKWSSDNSAKNDDLIPEGWMRI